MVVYDERGIPKTTDGVVAMALLYYHHSETLH